MNRVSIGLPDKEYAELKELSEKHRISMAWLGRCAIKEFIDRYRDGGLQVPLRPVEPRQSKAK